jgi:hypothetical protein
LPSIYPLRLLPTAVFIIIDLICLRFGRVRCPRNAGTNPERYG